MIYINQSRYHINLGSLGRQIPKAEKFDTSEYSKEDLDKCVDFKRAVNRKEFIPIGEVGAEEEAGAEEVESKAVKVKTLKNSAVVVEQQKGEEETETDSMKQEVASKGKKNRTVKRIESSNGEAAVVVDQIQHTPDANEYGAKPVGNVKTSGKTVTMNAPKDIEELEKDIVAATPIKKASISSSSTNYDKMSYKELKAEAKAKGIKFVGVKKADLAEKLK